MCIKSMEEMVANYVDWKLHSDGGFWDDDELDMLNAAIREEEKDGGTEIS